MEPSPRRCCLPAWMLLLAFSSAGAATALEAQAAREREVNRELAEAATLESAGRQAEAIARYRAALRSDPGNLAALLGLERLWSATGTLDSLLPLVRGALALDSLDAAVLALGLRVWAQLGRDDSLAAAARRWAAAAPESPDPYREWALALAARGDLAGARRALGLGAQRLGDESLAQELAQLAALAGEWMGATRQWAALARGNPSVLPVASSSLARAPAAARSDMLALLLGAKGDSASRLLAAELLLAWDRAGEAWPLLDGNLPADPALATALLRRFADRARQVRGRQAALVRGYALERLASLEDRVAASRLRLEAAQAYAEAGDVAGAQRLLDQLTGPERAGPRALPALASMIRALAASGSPEEAERRLDAWADRLGGEERSELRYAVARAWLARERLDRAEAVLAPDSGIEADEIRGWIALYRGDLDRARELLRAAGSSVGSREDATRRLGVLVLLERVPGDRLVELGRAMQELARGDTLTALAHLRQAAQRLAPGGGRADLLQLAGELALARHDHRTAEEVLRAALAADSLGPAAPAAQLALARVLAETGRSDQAMERLEQLILAYPESAVLPQARRLLDWLRGAVPQ